SAMKGLSDQLLAMRAVLGGEGPVGASLPKRAAALIEDDPVARGVCHERIEAAIDLERSLMRGGPPAGTPELAAWIEEGVREILRQAALGAIVGTDLGAAADESLIAFGLAEGDAEITVSASNPRPLEADVLPDLPDMRDRPGMPGREAEDTPGIDETQPSSDADLNLTPSAEAAGGPADQAEVPFEEDDISDDQDTRIMEPIPSDDEIRI